MFRTRLERLVAKVGIAAILVSSSVYGAIFYVHTGNDVRAKQLTDAVLNGDLPKVELLLDEKPNVNGMMASPAGLFFPGANANSLLDTAIKNGHADVAECLLRHGAKLNPTSIAEIAALNDTKVLEFEIKSGQSPLEMLRFACRAGNSVQARYLLAHLPRLKVANTQEPSISTLLPEAAKNGYAGLVKVLLDNGADINIDGYEMMTPLMHAAKNGHVEAVKVLLAAHANTKQTDFRGQDAGSYARAGGHMEIVELLKHR